MSGAVRRGGTSGEVTVQGRTWNLKSGISEFGILAPSKFHDVEIPRFQQKSWNREFEAHTRNFGIWNPIAPCCLQTRNSQIPNSNSGPQRSFANSKFPDSQFQFRPPALLANSKFPDSQFALGAGIGIWNLGISSLQGALGGGIGIVRRLKLQLPYSHACKSLQGKQLIMTCSSCPKRGRAQRNGHEDVSQGPKGAHPHKGAGLQYSYRYRTTVWTYGSKCPFARLLCQTS